MARVTHLFVDQWDAMNRKALCGQVKGDHRGLNVLAYFAALTLGHRICGKCKIAAARHVKEER